jgi:hypothetical protein
MKSFEKPLHLITQAGQYMLPKSEAARRTQLLTALVLGVGLVVALLIVL